MAATSGSMTISMITMKISVAPSMRQNDAPSVKNATGVLPMPRASRVSPT